jgi:hypothetical protein
MTPPAAVVKDSKRLDLDEFGAQLAAAWSRLGERFLKLECWQEYQELEAAESQSAYNRGDIDLARDLLRSEAESDRPLYQDVKRTSRDMYSFWKKVRTARVAVTGGDKGEDFFTSEVDRAFNAFSAPPSRAADRFREALAALRWRRQRQSRITLGLTGSQHAGEAGALTRGASYWTAWYSLRLA